jgi:hypothetical protein
MIIFNANEGNFWYSRIGQQLRLLKLSSSFYHNANIETHKLIERVGREVLIRCNKLGFWPHIGIHNRCLELLWSHRGKIEVSLNGKKISYTPDPIRKTSTLGMVLDVSNLQPLDLDKFIKGCLWHLFDVKP